MTRFMMTLDDAVDLVVYAFKNAQSGDIFVQKAPASSLETLACSLIDLLGKPDYPINIIGTRHGEKLYESLLSREEMVQAEDLGRYYRVPPDLRNLNYSKFIEQGDEKISDSDDYNSHNTNQLNVNDLKNLLMKLSFMKAVSSGTYIDPEE